MFDEWQILEFNRVAVDIGANPIRTTENPETKEQEISEVEVLENYGVTPDFEMSELVNTGIEWLGGKVDFTPDENTKISSATNKVLGYHNISIENVHPYTNALLTIGFITLKRKGGAFFKKINPFKKKDQGEDMNIKKTDGERDEFGRLKL